MSNASHTEQYILRHVGLRFDPAADYTENTKLLVIELIRYRGQHRAVIALDDVIKLVNTRIKNPKMRPTGFDLKQQEAFLEWLRAVRTQLGPKIKKPKRKPMSKGLRVEAKKRKTERRTASRARTSPGYLTWQSHAHQQNTMANASLL